MLYKTTKKRFKLWLPGCLKIKFKKYLCLAIDTYQCKEESLQEKEERRTPKSTWTHRVEDRDNGLESGEKQTQLSIAGRRTMQRRHMFPDLEAGPSVNQIVSLFLMSTTPKHPQDLALRAVLSWPITGAPSKHTYTLAQSWLEGVINSFFLMHAFPFPKTEQVMVQAGNLKCTQHRLAFQILCSSETAQAQGEAGTTKQTEWTCSDRSWCVVSFGHGPSSILLGGRTETRKDDIEQITFPLLRPERSQGSSAMARSDSLADGRVNWNRRATTSLEFWSCSEQVVGLSTSEEGDGKWKAGELGRRRKPPEG